MKLAWLILLACLAGAGSVQAQGTGRAVVDDEIVTAPVSLDGVVLLRVRGTSSFPARDRAQAIQERIAGVASDRTIALDAVRPGEDAGMTRIVGGDRPIVTVVDADAALERLSRTNLAWAHASRIRQAIDGYPTACSGATDVILTPCLAWRYLLDAR